MKKSAIIIVTLMLVVGLLSACAEKTETVPVQMPAETETVEVIAVETFTSTDGYAVVLGTLMEQDDHHVVIKTSDNYDLDFQLDPETEIYAGEAGELLLGDMIAVVFEGQLDGLSTEGVKVITVSISAEEEDANESDDLQ